MRLRFISNFTISPASVRIVRRWRMLYRFIIPCSFCVVRSDNAISVRGTGGSLCYSTYTHIISINKLNTLHQLLFHCTSVSALTLTARYVLSHSHPSASLRRRSLRALFLLFLSTVAAAQLNYIVFVCFFVSFTLCFFFVPVFYFTPFGWVFCVRKAPGQCSNNNRMRKKMERILKHTCTLQSLSTTCRIYRFMNASSVAFNLFIGVYLLMCTYGRDTDVENSEKTTSTTTHTHTAEASAC